MRVKKQTFERLHQYCYRGEKHENLVNRLIDVCKRNEEKVNLSKKTVDRLLDFCGSNDIDEALNILMDKCKGIKKK